MAEGRKPMIMPEAVNTRRMVQFFVGITAAVMVAATVLLWAHYGTAVFLEMIRAGIATCFG